jgi:site-specific recombinase XerD
MAYPLDGTPNLRPGAEQDPTALARRYDPALDLDVLFEDFLADSASIINDRTERNYRYDFRYFRAWLEETDLAATLGSISKENLVAYIAWLQRRPKQKGAGTLSSHSVHHYARVVRTFVRWLVAEDLFPSDPFAGGQRGVMPKLGPRLLKTAKRGDVDTLLTGAGKAGRNRLETAGRGRDEAMIWLVTDTGIRTSEAVRLDLGDLDLEDGWIHVAKSKWDRERRVPISRETVAVLRRYLRRDRPVLTVVRHDETRPEEPLVVGRTGERLTAQGLYQAMDRTYRRGGGTGRFGLHRLRHHWGTTAAERGMHPLVSQRIMGHEDEKSQRVYQHPSDDVLKDEHRRVTPIRDISAARRRRVG